MQGNLQSSPHLECSDDIDESKHLCGLSTILVANIQEVKDRISHIEFIFCSQLFPNFQSRSKHLEKRFAQERRAAEDEWKKKESILLRQIDYLHVEKQQAQEQIQQLNLSLEQSNTRLMNAEQSLKERETEKKKCIVELEIQAKNEEIIADLKGQLRENNNEFVKVMEAQERLLQQIELKGNEVLVERSKRRSLCEEYKTKYKELKSENSFLRKKLGCTVDNKPHPERMESEQVSPMLLLNKRTFQDQEAALSSKPREMNNTETAFHKEPEGDRAGDAKSELPPTLKRAAPSWRDTRARQQARGADPHDDFLDTPMEEARKFINMALKEEAQDLQAPPPKDMDVNNSDDETQEIKQISVPRPASKGFKYIEPVRKKVERENFKGVECKQCKKFYDAVLPDGNEARRCEHHDGVSRHRYRYAPPMTPDGFWNIGFESEM